MSCVKPRGQVFSTVGADMWCASGACAELRPRHRAAGGLVGKGLCRSTTCKSRGLGCLPSTLVSLALSLSSMSDSSAVCAGLARQGVPESRSLLMDSCCRLCDKHCVLPVPVGSGSGESFQSGPTTSNAEWPCVVQSSVRPCRRGDVQALAEGGLGTKCFGWAGGICAVQSRKVHKCRGFPVGITKGDLSLKNSFECRELMPSVGKRGRFIK